MEDLMAQYLISFDEGAMTFPEEDLPDVGAAAHAVIREAMEAGVWVFCAGVTDPKHMSTVATDGTVADGQRSRKEHYLGGMTIIDVPSREVALEWGAKIAAACRCPQEVRELLADPEVYRGPATAADSSRSQG